jgi:tetratricopeptide (TPR) repeat protein
MAVRISKFHQLVKDDIMKNKYIKILFLFSILLFSAFSYAQKPKSQTQELKETTETFIKVEAIKAYETKLAKTLLVEANDPVVKNTMKKFWEAAKGLDKQQVNMLFQRFSNASKSSLKQLVNLSPGQLSSYVRDVTGNVNVDAKTLKQIIYGTGNKAGNATLKTLAEMDELIAKTGTVSRELLRKMQQEASGLDPKQARAFYDLLKNKLSSDWSDIVNVEDATKGPGQFIGTVVDGVFVLKDAYDIYNSDDDPEDKAIKATSKIIDYSAGTGAGAASAALGGGLGAGLIIAFSANRVSTLYTEIAMLQKERKAAEDAEQNERIDNEILVRRQFVNISNKIKSGQIDNANFLLAKIQRFLINHNFQNTEKLLELYHELEDKAKKAERNELINAVINQARYPYNTALNYYIKGVELNIAKTNAAEALNILKSNLKKYPEIGDLTAISKAQQLVKAINEKIANAPQLVITSVNAPGRVYVGQYIDINLSVKGGIPYYRAVGNIMGNTSDDVVTMYWEAPSKPGKQNLTFKISDCIGNVVSASKSIEVINKDMEEEGEVVDDFPYGQWKVMIRPQGTISGDVQQANSKSEAETIIQKGMASYLNNPSFANNTAGFANLGDSGMMEFQKNGKFTYRKEKNLFILSNTGQGYQLNFAVKLTDNNHFSGKMFAYSQSAQGYWVNIQDVKGTKIK